MSASLPGSPGAAPLPLVAAVVLNFNRPADTLACLESLAASGYPNLAAAVLDLDSGPAFAAQARAALPGVEVLPLPDNRGYAGNNNHGLRWALARGAGWIFLLNDDTLLAPDCLQQLVQAGQAEPAWGLLGPTVYHASEPGIIQSAGGRLTAAWEAFHLNENEADNGQVPGPREVEWLSGCALLVRRQVVETAGLLDERFFMYWEEVEWCLRARRRGWRAVHVPAARVWHKGAQRPYQPTPAVTYYSMRNLFLMFGLHRAPPGAWLRAAAKAGRTLAAWTLRPRWRGKAQHRRALWCALRDAALRRWGQGFYT